MWGESTALDLRKSLNVEMNDETQGERKGRCGRAGGEDSSHQGLLGLAGRTHTELPPFSLHKRSPATGADEDCLQREMEFFLMVNHKRMLLHPASYGL